MPPKSIQLLINPAAGSRRINRVIEAATLRLASPHFKLHIKVLSSPEEAYVLSRLAVKRRFYAVVVSGGDGTINEVARALMGTKTALGVIPGGTGNGFARSMKLPLSPEKACDVLALAKPRAIDLGVLDQSRVFANVAGFGFDAYAATLANRLRWIGRISGFLRYVVAGISTVFSYKPPSFSVRAGRFRYDGPIFLLCIANAEQYGFGTVIVPGADPFDGELDGVVIPPLSIPRFFAGSFQALRGRRIMGAHYFRAGRIRISMHPGHQAPLHLDGEAAGCAPAEIRVKKGGLKVLLP